MGLKLSAERVFGWTQLYLNLADWPDRIRECHRSGNRLRDELTFYLCFFSQAYSIRDWLRKQGVTTTQVIDAAIAGEPAMRMCRDICNRYKHYIITSPSIDAGWSIQRRLVNPFVGDDEWEWTIIADEHHLSLWDLMIRCIGFGRRSLLPMDWTLRLIGVREGTPVQVLPTKYHGILYRSRCEARWAVAFDKVGWNHRYEPESYRLPCGPYLPDFYLPDVDIFFEVKASHPTVKELRKAEQLCVASEKPVVISTGPPDPRRDEIDNDFIVFYPEMIDEEIIAFQYEGAFVSRRFSLHPSCSLHLGNLSYLGSLNDVGWREAFSAAANERFSVYAS
jgi:hypothetical protein